ncbi:hypothetical protein HPB50_024628 [Hyalomma asiaticum]|uniref:Uncharacterized protein n=1 Tax=Hyalomma asiaticum TaxID=266040 RepID=A0ACB7S942_HYAAI|nr:hypothetical protein HPB50_024628 [Hyalomma asiaticum]
MVAEGFRLNHEKVAVEAVGPPVMYVNVYRRPAYLLDDVLTNALQQYGKVKSVTFATVATRENKLNGVRVVKMEMSKPVPNFTTIQGHRFMCEYRGMRRVCARCGDNSHMASACTRPYCKRCGVFGHDTEGCVEECKRCGGHHGRRDCFRRRSYVEAARGFPSASDPPPNRDQSSDPASFKTSASTSGLQRDGSEDTASVTSDSDHLAICASESSSAKPCPNSSSSPSSEEQAVLTLAASLDTAQTVSPNANSESLAQPPLGISRVASLDDTPIVSCGRYVLPPDHAYVIPASDPGPSHQALVDSRTEAAPPTAGASQPGLGQQQRSRSRRRQGDRDGSEPKERAGSTENNLRRSKTAVVSSDSDAARRAESKKPRKGSLGNGSPSREGNRNPNASSQSSCSRHRPLYSFLSWFVSPWKLIRTPLSPAYHVCARSKASDFFGKGLLLYWCSTNTKYLDADRHTGPVAEFPSPFYKMTANTKRMLDKEAPSCDLDRDPTARIAETLTRSQLSPEECGKTATWKRPKAKLSRGLPREQGKSKEASGEQNQCRKTDTEEETVEWHSWCSEARERPGEVGLDHRAACLSFTNSTGRSWTTCPTTSPEALYAAYFEFSGSKIQAVEDSFLYVNKYCLCHTIVNDEGLTAVLAVYLLF